MKKIITAVLSAALLAVGCLAAANMTSSHTTLHARLAAQTAPEDPCTVPIAFLGASTQGTYNDEAFYQTSCTSPPVQLTPSGNQGAHYVAMVPGGKDVIVALDDTPNATGQPTHLVEVNIQTLAETDIATTPAPMWWGLSVSPSGDAVAYFQQAYGGTPQGIYVQKLDGSAPLRISPIDVATYGQPTGPPAWSHDGKDIAYLATSSTGVHRVAFAYAPASGSQAQTEITGPILDATFNGADGPIAWTPDDQGLLYSASTTGVLNYVDRSSGTISYIASLRIPSDAITVIDSISVDQHWTVFLSFGLGNGSGGVSDSLGMWLGDRSAVTNVSNSAGLGTEAPSVDTSGPADPPPPGWPSAANPSPSPTSTSPSPSPSPSPTSPSPSPTATASCPSILFIGVRGSGEKSSDAHGYGVTIASVKDHLQHLIPGMQPQAIGYPAIPVQWWDPKYVINYDNSVADGVNNLDKVAVPFMVKCPHTYEDWAGYSQGVDVITQAFANLTKAKKQHVLLQAFGDPHFNPNQDAVDYGNYNNKLSGILVHFFGDQPTVYENRSAYRVQSWCAAGDPICNYSKLNLAACVPMLTTGVCLHQWYVALGYTGDAATYAYKLWKSLPALK